MSLEDLRTFWRHEQVHPNPNPHPKPRSQPNPNPNPNPNQGDIWRREHAGGADAEQEEVQPEP